MTNAPSFFKKIRLTFIVLTSVMFLLFWGLIYFAQDRLEVISLEHRLTTETKEYLKNYRRYGFKADKPDPQELDTYWSKEEHPEWLEPYQTPGFFEEQLGPEDKHFLVTKHPSGSGWLYVVFQDDADDYLDEYEDNLHLITFLVGAVFLMAVMAYGLYFVRLFSRPLIQIEGKIDSMAPDKPDFVVDTPYKETRSIEYTLLDNKAKIASYFQREQEFSRFASHELRTPIMVIKGSTELLRKVPDMPRVATKAVNRIEYAGNQMQILTEAFLLLGKEDIEAHHISRESLSEHIHTVLENMSEHFSKQDASYQLKEVDPCTVDAPSSFIDIVMANLLKNAFSYSIGDIVVELTDKSLIVTNQHDGNDMHNSGYGCGLVIIERVCNRMNWQFNTENDGKLFKARVVFG
ncbi:HAMP domain-containing sensor histidine kinase [Vibrio sp. CK2-1]|uniref:sensor histidine kinase n=1 Tax=Vibrio sp. CK2-1 TaxID=2912249 RepID=UPI001F1C781F|nr:HAMP domain-containing sensor histidine kinase [Vibrio sp. CK2-1]MCF7353210.1 HAMP domain-containing histidine kinase [Vibrio sp. CK2-1]